MVKSKRAREAAESAVESAPAEAVANGTSASHDKKAKKRKRDEEEVNGAGGDDAVASEKKKSKKDKKDKKSKKHGEESRKEKKDKRKNIQDLPDEVMEDEDTPQEAEAVAKGSSDDAEVKRKEEKRARKQAKREKKEREQAAAGEQGTASATSKSNAKTAPSATTTTSKPDKNAQAEGGSDPIDLNGEGDDAAAGDGKKDRHIVFVGNLPFSATAASISAHFASLSPVAVRCLRNKDDPNPCRGIAFVEFGKVWHMRTCLDKFHHSTFDDGVSPARKINVELTAGGGGKTKQRQQKIKDKNKKLDENRAKRIEREKQPKQENGAAGGKASHHEDAIHPSRRARVPGGGF